MTDRPENITNDISDQALWELQALSRVVLSGDQTNGTFAIIDLVVSPDDEPPLHLHTREDEVIYVMTGSIEVLLDGCRSEHVAGDAVFLPKGREHSYRLRSEWARLLFLSTPAGIEGFYRDLGHTITQDQRVERLITLAARYGVEITGPGLREASIDTDDSRDSEEA